MRTYSLNLFLFIGILSLLVASCSPEKRIARIIKNHPEIIKKDTIWRKDTIVVAGASKDSSFSFYQRDTVFLKKDNMTVKYYFNKDSTVFIQGKCDPKIIYKSYPVVINSVDVAKALTWKERVDLWIFHNWWWMAILIYLCYRFFGDAIKTWIKIRFPFVK